MVVVAAGGGRGSAASSQWNVRRVERIRHGGERLSRIECRKTATACRASHLDVQPARLAVEHACAKIEHGREKAIGDGHCCGDCTADLRAITGRVVQAKRHVTGGIHGDAILFQLALIREATTEGNLRLLWQQHLTSYAECAAEQSGNEDGDAS